MDDSAESNIGIVLGILAAAAVVIVGVVVLVVLLLGSIVISSSIASDSAVAPTETSEAEANIVVLPTAIPKVTPNKEDAESKDAPIDEAVVAAPVLADDGEDSAESAKAPLPSAGRIAIINNAQQLVTINPDGDDMRLLSDSADSRGYQFPAWSADSERIAAIFASLRSDSGVMVFEDNAEAEPVEAYVSEGSAPIYLYWSPDSELISFIESSSRGLDFKVVPPDGADSAEIYGFGSPFYWDWSSDSREIWAHTGTAQRENSTLTVIDAATGRSSTISDDFGGFFQTPDLSPDDTQLAFAEGKGRRDRELIILSRSTDERFVVEHDGLVSLAWSPAGDKLAFISSETQALGSSYGPMRLVDTDGNVTVIEDRFVLSFFWSPDGKYIAYIMPPAPIDNELEASARQRMAKPQLQAQETKVALWVVDTETGDRNQLALFEPTDLFVQQFLPFFDQYARSHSIWSPQSEAFVLPLIEDGRSVVYRFFVDGRLPTFVAEGAIGFWSH